MTYIFLYSLYLVKGGIDCRGLKDDLYILVFFIFGKGCCKLVWFNVACELFRWGGRFIIAHGLELIG